MNPGSRLPAADAHTQVDESTHPTTASSSSVAASPGLPDRPSTPAATEPADSRPTTPRQQLGDGFSVVPGPSRRLQRERPFSVAPDPMWNSSREIQLDEPLATGPPPPPYVQTRNVLPPTYAEVVPLRQYEAVETIEIEPSTLRSPTLDVRHVSVSSRVIPDVPVTEEDEEEEANDNSSPSLNPSWTFPPTTQAPNPTASEDRADEVAENSSSSENETGDVGSSDEHPKGESELSEKARGKKRMRDEDDEYDESETLAHLLGDVGSSSGSGSYTSSDCDGQPDRKRTKTDTDTDSGINTDPLEVDPSVLIVARMGIFNTLTDVEGCRQVKKLKEIEKLYRSGRLSLA